MHIRLGNKERPCVRCGFTTFFRFKRKWWMRVIWGSKFYCCDTCSEMYYVLFNTQNDQSKLENKSPHHSSGDNINADVH